MSVKWDSYPSEKKQIKIKYLELLKERFNGEKFHVRNKLTKWALRQFPNLSIPEEQFVGTFDHSRNGFFVKEHGFIVTQMVVTEEASKSNKSEIEYIDVLINAVKDDKKLSR